MSITGKLKSVLLTYSFVSSISINLFTTLSEAAGGPPRPPPPPPPEWTSQAASSNNTGSGGQTTQPKSSKSTSSKKPSSSTKTPPPQSLEVTTPTGEFGKKYAKLINPEAGKQNLKIEFPKKIISLVRDELTLKYFATDADKILTLLE